MALIEASQVAGQHGQLVYVALRSQHTMAEINQIPISFTGDLYPIYYIMFELGFLFCLDVIGILMLLGITAEYGGGR